MTTYGLSSAGFTAMRQADLVTALVADFQAAFGGNINTSSGTVFGTEINIFAERLALLWEALEDVYNSQYPNGAEGVAVDNLLALNGLEREGATATVTNPTPLAQSNGTILNGLELYGTPGTVIPAGSIVQTGATPPISFTLDETLTIEAAVNCIQTIVLSATPTSGSFQLSLTDSDSDLLSTNSIVYNAGVQTTAFTVSSALSSGAYYLSIGQLITTSLAYNADAPTIQAAIQALSGYSDATVTGTLAAGFQIAWGASYNPYVTTNATRLSYSATPASGSFALVFGSQTTAALGYGATASDIQSAIRALSGYEQVTVTSGGSNAFLLNWLDIAPITVTVTSNSLMTSAPAAVSVTLAASSTLASAPTIINSMQSQINTLYDANSNVFPFTDVAWTQGSVGYVITFGAYAPLAGQPTSAGQPTPTIGVKSNSLFHNTTFCNIQISQTESGQPAMAIGTATCTETGANAVSAGLIRNIGSPVSGWTGVNNPLDCITGSSIETDADALIRRAGAVSASASGPLSSTIAKVKEVTGVSSAFAYQNTTGAAMQSIVFATVPTTGTFALSVNNNTTASIAYNATALDVQNALESLVGYNNTLVDGSIASGLVVDFNGAQGGQPQPLIQVINNTTGVTITSYFARPPASVEYVVAGGDDNDVATAIYNAQTGGINTYGSPVLITTGSVTLASNSMSVSSSVGLTVGLAVQGSGVSAGTYVASISGTTITLSKPAIATYSGSTYRFLHAITLYDNYNNPQIIAFSRPVSVPIYVSITLLTDIYNTPGNSASGVNSAAKFNPQSIINIQQDILNIGNGIGAGGTIIARGTNGLIGAFNDVAGILDFTLTFGTTANPTGSSNITLGDEQAPVFESFNISVVYA